MATKVLLDAWAKFLATANFTHLWAVAIGVIFLAGFFTSVRRWRWLSAPLTRALLSFVIVSLGIISSFYLKELKDAIEIIYEQRDTKIDPVAVNFGLSFLLSLAFFFLSESSVQEREAIQTQELQDLINSSPPSDFLQRYSELCSESFITYAVIKENMATASKADVELGIRTILTQLVTITRFYSRETTPSIIYSANIMMEETPNASHQIVFQPPVLDITQLKAVLTTYKELSVTSKNPPADVDTSLPIISLPIFPDKDNRILPGAPEAYEAGAIFPVPDTRDKQWLQNVKKFDETVETQINKYFDEGDGKKIRSFISIPLVDEHDKCYAVLNIHSNKTSPWNTAQTAEKIMYLISPCLDHLGILLSHWKKM